MSFISSVSKHTRYLATSIGQDVLLNSNSGGRNTFLLSAYCITGSHYNLSIPHLGKFANNSNQHGGVSNRTAYPQNISNLSGLGAVVWSLLLFPCPLPVITSKFSSVAALQLQQHLQIPSTSSQSESLDCYQNQFSCLRYHEPHLFY